MVIGSGFRVSGQQWSARKLVFTQFWTFFFCKNPIFAGNVALDLNIFKDIFNLIDKANIHIDMDAYMYIAGLLSSYLQIY